MKTFAGSYNQNRATIGSKTYEVISIEKTELKYPGIFKAGTVAILTIKIGNQIGVVNEYRSGKFSGFKKSFSNTSRV